jgi:hypothetical protein
LSGLEGTEKKNENFHLVYSVLTKVQVSPKNSAALLSHPADTGV